MAWKQDKAHCSWNQSITLNVQFCLGNLFKSWFLMQEVAKSIAVFTGEVLKTMETFQPNNKKNKKNEKMGSWFVGRQDQRNKRISCTQSLATEPPCFFVYLTAVDFSKVHDSSCVGQGHFLFSIGISSELPTMSSWQIISCVPWQMAPVAAAGQYWWDSLSRISTIACFPGSTLQVSW